MFAELRETVMEVNTQKMMKITIGIKIPSFHPGPKLKSKLIMHQCFSIVIWLVLVTSVIGCPRDRSKLVRNVVKKHLLPLYKEYETSMPRSCPLSQERDIFGDQESNKAEESPSRWQCEYCGKQFTSEFFLDKHMDNRHSDRIKKEHDTTCLADYCDAFRCDVLSSYKPYDYWTKALCKEERLISLKKKCMVLLEPCIPRVLVIDEEREFREKFNDMVCNFLSCEKYYDKPDSNEKSVTLVIYIVILIFFIFSLIIYYVIAYTHFYEEPIFDSHHKFDEDVDDSSYRYYTQTEQALRSRHIPSYAR